VEFKNDASKRGNVSPVRAVLVVGKAGHNNSSQISRLADAKSRCRYRESETTLGISGSRALSKHSFVPLFIKHGVLDYCLHYLITLGTPFPRCPPENRPNSIPGLEPKIPSHICTGPKPLKICGHGVKTDGELQDGERGSVRNARGGPRVVANNEGCCRLGNRWHAAQPLYVLIRPSGFVCQVRYHSLTVVA
jgi:hypothetical protein